MSYAIGREHPQAPWSPARGMAFHHIIPRSILIQVFNRLLADHIQSAAADTRACLFQFLALCNRSYTAQEKVVERLRSDPRAPRRAGHNPLAPLSTPELTAIHRSVIWPAWDIVEGPANRSDDPRDRYMDRFTAGLTPDDTQQMRAIEFLYPALQSAIGAGASASLSASIRAARGSLTREAPIRYRPDMWELSPAGARKKR